MCVCVCVGVTVCVCVGVIAWVRKGVCMGEEGSVWVEQP